MTPQPRSRAPARTREFLRIVTRHDLDADAAWVERALCAQSDPEAFFPEKGGNVRPAKKICLRCEVTAQCLAASLAEPPERFGIWGGMTERERRRLTRRRRAGMDAA